MARLAETAPGLPSLWVRRANATADDKSSFKEDGLLKNIKAETLVLVGREDWICPPSIAERIHHAVARSNLRVFEKTGHFPWIEAPQEFFDEVKQFARASSDSNGPSSVRPAGAAR